MPTRPAIVVVSIASIFATAAACGGDNGRVCTVDAEMQLDTRVTKPADCGKFDRGDVNYTDDAMLAAQRCVLNALANKQSFQLIYDASADTGRTDTNLRAGWLGLVSGNRMPSNRFYASTVDAGSDLGQAISVTAQTCSMVDATDSCKPRVGVPCLTCVIGELDIGQVRCRGL